MNQDQIQEILTQLDAVDEIDLSGTIAEDHPDENLDEICFGDFTVNEFIYLTKRTIEQFRSELDSELAFLLPVAYLPEYQNFSINRNQAIDWNALGIVSIVSTLSLFYQLIHGKNFTGAAGRLKELIAYQRQHGFWDRSERPVHDLNGVDVEKMRAEIEAGKKQQEEVLNALKEVSKEYADRTAALERWASTAETRLEEATASNNQISELLNSSTAHDAKLEEISSNQSAVFSEAKEVHSSLTKQLHSHPTGFSWELCLSSDKKGGRRRIPTKESEA